ncbi:MAG: JAB domain-containing protein [Thermodesulfobacteriota bacterium]
MIPTGEILGIKLLDHIIFNRTSYYSLLEKNEIGVNASQTLRLPG